MAFDRIWIKGKTYYYYDSYGDWRTARAVALRFRKRNGSRYFILSKEKGFVFPEKTYRLYLTRAARLL